MNSQVFVGLDVSQQHLDVAVRSQGRHLVTPNGDRGIKQLVKRLAALKPQLIVLEASGGYEFLAAGKPKKLALTACMRKLVRILNAMMKNNQPWNQCITQVP